MRNGMRWPLLALLLPQQFNEPTADCISSLIDLSEHANAHADRINPAVTHCLHNNAWTHKSSLQTTRKLMEKWNPLLLSHQSGCWADRLTYLTFWQVSQNGLIQAGVTTLSELPHAEFLPCLDLYMCVVYMWYGSELQLAFTPLAIIFFQSAHSPVSQKRLNVHNVTLDQKRSYLKLVQHFRKCPYLLYYQESDEKIDPSLISALQYAGG